MELHPTLRELSHRNLEWAKSKLFERYIYANGGEMWCSECGESWAGEPWVYERPYMCPKCAQTLTLKKSRKQKCDGERYYFTVLDTCKEWQVVRHYIICRSARRGTKAYYDIAEVVQIWIDDDGHEVILSSPRRGLCGYYDAWITWAPMGVRYRGSYGPDCYNINAPIAPSAKLTERVKRNGYTRRLHGLSADTLIKALLTEPRVETMTKAGQYSLVAFFCGYGVVTEKYWPAIKIAMRNGYKVTDASLWRDYINDCIRLGRDIRNKVYVCPRNLAKAHDATRAIIAKIEAAERKRKCALEAIEENKKYQERWAALLSLRLQFGNLTARMLRNVEEFYEEGEEQRHCVYHNRYYSRSESAIFTVRNADGKREATVEYDIERGEVVQCRGKANTKPKRYTDIMAMFSANKVIINKKLNSISL